MNTTDLYTTHQRWDNVSPQNESNVINRLTETVTSKATQSGFKISEAMATQIREIIGNREVAPSSDIIQSLVSLNSIYGELYKKLTPIQALSPDHVFAIVAVVKDAPCTSPCQKQVCSAVVAPTSKGVLGRLRSAFAGLANSLLAGVRAYSNRQPAPASDMPYHLWK